MEIFKQMFKIFLSGIAHETVVTVHEDEEEPVLNIELSDFSPKTKPGGFVAADDPYGKVELKYRETVILGKASLVFPLMRHWVDYCFGGMCSSIDVLGFVPHRSRASLQNTTFVTGREQERYSIWCSHHFVLMVKFAANGEEYPLDVAADHCGYASFPWSAIPRRLHEANRVEQIIQQMTLDRLETLPASMHPPVSWTPRSDEAHRTIAKAFDPRMDEWTRREGSSNVATLVNLSTSEFQTRGREMIDHVEHGLASSINLLKRSGKYRWYREPAGRFGLGLKRNMEESKRLGVWGFEDRG
ncbi:hypothetical protein EJ08DRAFT_738673 [Tothia fuscella]|uniref:Uncharacterized protein n=1 Tax=Tothia fuscella TaxID=1048955 RepID=A0A9P4NGE6_9PEZI|nr:hypothetical protein EJ08DRAFT_738673 [Tothia fuscella]